MWLCRHQKIRMSGSQALQTADATVMRRKPSRGENIICKVVIPKAAHMDLCIYVGQITQGGKASGPGKVAGAGHKRLLVKRHVTF
jgi:hypothetical protein